MLERLKWILTQVNKLMEDGNVRYEGNPVFQGLRMELESVIGGYDGVIAGLIAAAPIPAPVENVVMSAEQFAQVLASLGERDAALLTQVRATVDDALEASDVAVMGAINAKGDDIIAALKPAE